MTEGKILHANFGVKKTEEATGVVSFPEQEPPADNVVNFNIFKDKKLAIAASEFPPENTEKFKHFVNLMNNGLTHIVVNSASADVSVPNHLKGNYALVLKMSHKFGCVDMVYDIEGTRATLSYNGEKFYTVIPWKQVWQIYSPSEGVNSMKVWSVDTGAENVPPTLET